MKKKNSKRENVNLFFSAFLMLAYIVCGYFFAQYANSQSGELKAAVTAIIFIIFGLLVFYATRVGEGKPVKRFSIITLILLDLPALYIIIASIFTVMPLHDFFVEGTTGAPTIVVYMAAVALGYGIPYTFLSGFETVPEDSEEEDETEENTVLEGGVEADLEQEEEAPEAEESVDEVVVEGVAAEEDSEEETPAEEKAEEESAEETE